MPPTTESICHQLTIGQENRDMDLYVTYGIEGEQKTRMKCDSFLAPMINHIYNRITGAANKVTYPKAWKLFNNISSYIYSANDQIRMAKTDSDWGGFDPTVSTHIMPASYKEYFASGIFEFTIASEDASYYYLQLPNGSINTTTSLTYFDFYMLAPNQAFDLYVDSLVPYVGFDTNPVKIDEPYSVYKCFDFDMSAVNYAVLTTDQQSAVMTVSRSFTNDTDADIVITEIGLEDDPHVVAKDVLQSAKIVPTGKTLTLDYEVRVDLNNFTQDTETDGVNGGFVEQFAISIRDMIVGNVNATMASYILLFSMFGEGDATDMYARRRNDEFGIRLGQNNKFVSMTDTNLNPDGTAGLEPIVHGDGDGQLHYYAMGMSLLTVDAARNEASFVIYREFENKGEIPVTAKEVGLFGNTEVQSNASWVSHIFDSDKPTPSLIARTALDTANAIIFNPGERRRIEYEVRIFV